MIKNKNNNYNGNKTQLKNNNNANVKKVVKKEVKKDINKLLNNQIRDRHKQIQIREFPSTIKSQRPVYANKSFTTQQLLHYRNIMDPWGAKEARWYQDNAGVTRTAKPITTFKLTSNSLGNLLVMFDPDFCNTSAGGLTNFFYVNDSTLTGLTQLNTAIYQTPGAGSAPLPPANTVSRIRLVSAGIKATVKLSELNMVGTAFVCDDYGDLLGAATSSTTLPAADVGNMPLYTVFANVIQGNNGYKRDISSIDNCVYWTWYPMDPTAEVFNDPATDVAEIGEGNSGVPSFSSAGSSPKMVIAFESLSNGAATVVEFEIVWNFEYVGNPIAVPWIGGGGVGIPQLDHIQVMDKIRTEHPHGSMSTDQYLDVIQDLSSHVDFEGPKRNYT